MPHRANRSFVSNSDALTAWTPLAIDILREAAATYRAVVSEHELAYAVQERSGIAADQPADVWIDRLLDRVVKETTRRDEPPLAALCPRPGDDEQAAIDRLACYRAYAADLPADGGQPAPVRRPSARRAPARRAPAATRPPAPPSLRETTCTSCFMIVAVRETCSSCGAPLPA